MPIEEHCNIKRAMELLGIGHCVLRKMLQAKNEHGVNPYFPGRYRLNDRGDWRIPLSDIELFISRLQAGDLDMAKRFEKAVKYV